MSKWLRLQSPLLEQSSNCTSRPRFATHPVISANGTWAPSPTPPSVFASSAYRCLPLPSPGLLQAQVEICTLGVMSTSEGKRMRNALRSYQASLWSKLIEGIYFLPPALRRKNRSNRSIQPEEADLQVDWRWVPGRGPLCTSKAAMQRLPGNEPVQEEARKYICKPPVPFLWHCSDSCKIRMLSPTPFL